MTPTQKALELIFTFGDLAGKVCKEVLTVLGSIDELEAVDNLILYYWLEVELKIKELTK